MIDEEARALVQRAYDRTMALLMERRDEAEMVAKKLLEQEVLSKDDMVELLGVRLVTIPLVLEPGHLAPRWLFFVACFCF
jgi:hypothetical protein